MNLRSLSSLSIYQPFSLTTTAYDIGHDYDPRVECSRSQSRFPEYSTETCTPRQPATASGKHVARIRFILYEKEMNYPKMGLNESFFICLTHSPLVFPVGERDEYEREYDHELEQRYP